MKLIESFKQSIKNNKLSEFTEEYAEITIDSLTDNELLKNIPIVKCVLALAEIKASIQQKHTIKKLVRFLEALHDIPEKEKAEFLNKLEQDKKEEESIFENLIILIDRLDETEKAFIIGNFFKLYVLEIISKDRFIRFSNIIEKAFLQDLLALHSVEHRVRTSGDSNQSLRRQFHTHETKSSLYNLGLLKQKITTQLNESKEIKKQEAKIEYVVTTLGYELANMLYFKKSDLDYFKQFFKSHY